MLTSLSKKYGTSFIPAIAFALGFLVLVAILFAFSKIPLTSSVNTKGEVLFVNSDFEPVSVPNIQGIQSTLNSTDILLAKRTNVPSLSLLSIYTSSRDVYFASEDGRYLFDGDIIDTKKGYSVRDRELSKVNFSGSLGESENTHPDHLRQSSAQVNMSEKVVSFDSESYDSAIRSRIASIQQARPVLIPERTPSPAPVNIGQPQSTLPNEECLITFGGFNQPKIGYDDSCNTLSAEARQEQVKTMMNSFPKEFFIRYEAEDERAEVFVFTDYTCPFCRNLHDKMDEFLSNGVSVNYIFYPRAIGMQGQDAMAEEIATNMRSAWCSDDQQSATDTLFARRTVPYATCEKNDGKLDSPIRQHYILGMMFDISGTPLIVGSNGATTYGFRSVSLTLSRLGL